MIKIIDLDALFDSYISDYVYKNVGKVKPEEIENNIPVLYTKFGDERLKELDGLTPNTYYAQFTAEELLTALDEHISSDVSVSDFLCEAIIANPDSSKVICKLLSQEKGEEFTIYLLNLLTDLDGELPKNRLLEMVLYDESLPIREVATQLLGSVSNDVKEQVISVFNDSSDSVKADLVDIISNCEKDQRVFDILINEFIKHTENVPLYASYLSKYGDERALPYLLEAIENPKISYPDFEEIRFAIEALGGEYTKQRDFSNDKYYKKLKN